MPTAREVFAGGLAVVTGAGAGIGAGLTRHLAGDLGMTVIAADVDAEAVHRIAGELGRHVVPHVVDVRDPDAVDRLARHVEEEFGPVRLLINNAGVEQFGYLWDVSPTNWQRVVEVNISGVFHGIRAFLPGMIAAGGRSHVLSLASIGAVTSLPLQAPYIMSKHAVLAMTECLHQEVAEVGADIVVSAVLPGLVESDIFRSAGGVESGDVAAAEEQRRTMLAIREQAISADEAAEAIVAQAARGEFYIVTHPELVHAAMAARAEQLVNRRPPAPHRSRFAAAEQARRRMRRQSR
ncbi:NADP-dependent 3-hydroxy acid dehydrogenase YdfG [Saccharopolyspora kobensis]|uniref:NADP-dependent 3-hydroxy acid dehydrogenase YdfG n=1 Tax=Saccharopolyspora kobensis TaxID=146035 RepID=A0A1H5VNF0_9PSEU|nr:SDR family NAD(P)-dependent oxidoreductase [Saccharopolyspora kobensis]SEF88341.1 NADP-dependent 3-hydroxy acid dehydrogenase YdfG [Saccharopolyspora kobensis]SFC59383.1 NADP-dependent 3-hydroxy acid dehydrogenase YdfG [Saccharopolyspora kobensis]